jgi:prevent-host-death family protein
MEKNTVSVTDFKAHCLEILREVHDDGVQYTVTKHNKVIAQVMPPPKPGSEVNPLKDSVLFEDDIISPVDDAWEAGT